MSNLLRKICKTIGLGMVIVLALPTVLTLLWIFWTMTSFSLGLTDGWGSFYEESSAAYDEARSVLIKRGYCETNQACSEKASLILSRDVRRGFDVKIYGISDEHVLQEIVQVFFSKFLSVPAIESLSVEAYPFARMERYTPRNWFTVSSYKLNLRRKP